MVRTNDSTRGFSLIEIVISLAIIGVILVIYQLSISTTSLVRVSKNKEIAVRAASNQLQDLRALGYAGLSAGGTFTDTQLGPLPGVQGAYSISAYNASTKQVTVTVTWNEAGASGVQTITLSTLVTETGGL